MEISSESVRGRDDEKETIVRFLTESRNKTAVVTIWGIGGIGKTTLARLVCKDEKVQSHFHPLLWANARHAFHLNTIIEDLLELDHYRRGILSIGDLQERLKRRIEGRTCLLVLDDVGKLAPEQCQELRDLFKVGIAGVLISTVEDQDIDLVNKDETELSRKPTQAHMTIKKKTRSRIVKLGEEVGIEEGKKNIKDFVLEESEDKLSTIFIEGIIDAETNPVQSICNDRDVKDKFEFLKWVHVPSEEFNLKRIVRGILDEEEQGKTLEQLQIELQGKLQEKKRFPIGLDVWGMNAHQCDRLEVLMKNGKVGNKLLITTRDKQVPPIVLLAHMKMHLDFLSITDNLNLVVKNAEFAEIGREIIEGCSGVPLLLRMFGGIFSHEIDENKLKEIQEKIKNSSDVSEILKLSFDTLPPHVKMCFLYSTCFTLHPPERGRLTQQWLAHDLIEGSENKQNLEDLARECFDELLSRSFFYNLVEDDLTAEARFEVHDLVHKLAHKVSEGEYCITSSDQIENISSTILHLAFSNKSEKFPSLRKLKKLRTFKWGNFGLSSATSGTKLDMDSLSRSLRVLDLSCSKFEELPSSIGELRDLRYLDVSYNIYLDELPNSLFELSNLETLRFEECGILELPRDFSKLKKLRNLYACTEQGSIPEEVICGLASIRILHLNPVHNLETLPKSLENLTALETLVLRLCSQLTLLDTDTKGLQSLRNLTITHIKNKKSCLIPSSLHDADAAASLSSLCLSYCMGMTTLPEWLVKLQRLRRLHIEFCPNLTPSPKGIFLPKCLEYLSIRGCPELTKICESEDWQHENEDIREIHLDGRIIRSISNTRSSDATSSSSVHVEKDGRERGKITYVGSSKLSPSSSGEGMESAISEEESELCFLLCSLFPEDSDIPIESIVRYAIGIGLFGDATTMSQVRARVNAALQPLRGEFYFSGTTSNYFRRGYRYLSEITSYIFRRGYRHRYLSKSTSKSFRMGYRGRNLARSAAHEREHKSFIQTRACLNKWPESDLMDQFTYISLMENEIKKLPEKIGCPRLLLLSLLGNKWLRYIPHSCFQEMTMLQVLDLSASKYLGLNFRLPPSLECLESLRSLLLDFCKLEGGLSVIGNLSKLEILSLRGSNIRDLPAEIGRLKQLRLLDLDNCGQLKSIPANVISSLCKLEELYLKRGFRNWEVYEGVTAVSQRNASFSEIQSLSSLAVFSANVDDVNCLPDDFSFSHNLTKFDLQIGKISSSTSLPNQDADIRQGPWINNFFLWGDNHRHTHIQLASSLLPKAGHLILEHVLMTPILNDSDEEGAFDALKSLRLRDCGGLEYLSGRRSTNAAFANLEELRLEMLTSMKGLGEEVPNPGSFQNLRILEIRKCEQLSGVIPSNWIRNFSKLEQLHVDSSSSVTEIIDVEEIAKELEMAPPLASIKKLHLQSLKGLLSICKGPGKIISFRNLIELHISDCPNLEFIFSPYMSQTLSHLQQLSIVGCDNLGVIFKETEEGAATGEIRPLKFPELIKMTVHQCEELKSLFPISSARGLVKLKELDISGCKSLTEIFKRKEEGAATDEIRPLKFPELNKMTVCQCEELTSLLPVSIARGLVKLKELDISGCKNLNEIFKETEEGAATDEIQPLKFPELNKMTVCQCEELKSLFPISSARGLVKLKELDISGCKSLTEIFKRTEEGAATDDIRPLKFPELNKMTVHQCEGLESLFPVSIARGLVNLEELYISGCKKLTEFFKKTEEGAAMDEIRPLKFPKLNKMTVRQCEGLNSLFPVSIARGLVNLEELDISDCEKLEVLVSRGDSTGTEREANSNEIKLPQLRRITLRVLIRFERFCPEDYSLCLPSLQELIYRGFSLGLTRLNADSFNVKIPRSARINYIPKFG